MVIDTRVCIFTSLSGGCCFPRVKSGQYGAGNMLWSVEVANLELLVVAAVCQQENVSADHQALN